MGFLDQLKTQASSLQSQRSQSEQMLDENVARTEAACRIVQGYLQDLGRQLSVIEPPAPALTLDGKTPWPAMKLVNFRVDARRKLLRDREVFDYIGMGWDILPRMGKPVGGAVTVNFPPDLKRVEDRLAMGSVKHERHEQRAEKGGLQFIRFEYMTQARGSVTITAVHDKAELQFRLVNTSGFEIVLINLPAARISTEVLDELAKRLVNQPHRFV